MSCASRLNMRARGHVIPPGKQPQCPFENLQQTCSELHLEQSQVSATANTPKQNISVTASNIINLFMFPLSGVGRRPKIWGLFCCRADPSLRYWLGENRNPRPRTGVRSSSKRQHRVDFSICQLRVQLRQATSRRIIHYQAIATVESVQAHQRG